MRSIIEIKMMGKSWYLFRGQFFAVCFMNMMKNLRELGSYSWKACGWVYQMFSKQCYSKDIISRY